MDEIMQIAETKRLLVVEDAAQALFSKYKDRFLGAIGHVSCLSFHETKNIISGEGGALLVNDKRFIERSEIIWQKGTNRNQFSRGEIDRYSWVDIGSSFLPSELTGAFLYGQLEQTQAIITLRRRICQRYHRLLSPLEEKGLIEISNVKNDRTSGHLFYLLTRSETERARLIKHLTKNNIVAVFHYVPLHSSPAGIKYGRASGDMSVTNRVSERLLRLPLYYEMSDQDVDRVVEVVTQFYL
jgi:dTDP-4-amino-4,6-dideoxygalactose transaminase